MSYDNYILVKKPPNTLIKGLTTKKHRALGTPDYNSTLAQHNAYVAALRKTSDKIIVLKQENEYPDSHYIQDTAAILDKYVIIANMNKKRNGETISIKNYLVNMGFEIIHMPPHAKIEFGDIVSLGEEGLLLGVSKRTNKYGAIHFSNIVKDIRHA